MTVYANLLETSDGVPDALEVAGRRVTGFRQLAPRDAMVFRTRMIEAARDCGCGIGAAFGGMFLSAYLAMTVLLPFLRQADSRFSSWRALGVLFAGSLIGKTIGTFRASRNFETALREFNQSLEKTRST